MLDELYVQGTMSYLHAINLAARSPAVNAQFSAADRELSLQLAALTKMLQQLKECKTNGTITAAREAKLTEMLFPILTDNAMTWVIASLLVSLVGCFTQTATAT